MWNNTPSETSVRSLTKFFESLINDLDDELGTSKAPSHSKHMDSEDNQLNIENVEVAAFEEIDNNANSIELSTNLSISGVWDDTTDISALLEYEYNLDRLQKIATYFQPEFNLESNKIEVSDISSALPSVVQTHEASSDFSDFSDENIVSLPQALKPYNLILGSPFHLFSLTNLKKSTEFTHDFPKSKRSAVYYGEYPYSYGGTYHEPKPISDNKYLLKILSYLEVVIPGVSYNSAMIHMYDSGEACIPHHADDEEEIDGNSQIITISLGESRSIEFKHMDTGSITSQKLNHGDVFVMSKLSQGFFTHSITKDQNNSLGPRISITVRLIKPPSCKVNSVVSSEPLQSSMGTVADFLLDLGKESEDLTTRPAIIAPLLPSKQLIPNAHAGNMNNPIHSNMGECTPTSQQQAQKTKTLYISSSMFRFIDTNRLSSGEQTAHKLFYPGANAKQMLNRLSNDPKFSSLEKRSISKIFLLTGTNNVDSIYYGDSNISFDSTVADISNLVSFLQSTFAASKIHIINILPRRTKGRMDIVNLLNDQIKLLCEDSSNLYYLDTFSNNMFVHREGTQRKEFFKQGGRFGSDDCHLNAQGVVRLGKHLKFVAHQ